MKAVWRFFLWAVAVFTVLLAGAIAIAVVYEDDVKKQLLGEINEQLQCKIEVDKIELTLIERFPKASLKFSNIIAYEALPEKVFPDTLLQADQLFLEFSLFGLLGKEYTVKNVVLRNASLDLVIDPQGVANYNLWKSNGSSSGGSAIELEKVQFENVRLAYLDSLKGFHTTLALNNTTISAELNEALYFDIRSDVFVDLIRSGNDTLAMGRNAMLETEFVFEKSTGAFHFERSKLALEKVPLYVTGKVETSVPPKLDLVVEGERLALEDLRQLLPQRMQNTLEPYGIGGRISMEGSLTGAIGDGNVPTLHANFELSDAKMTELTTNTVFDRINSDGRFVVSKEQIDLYLTHTEARSGPGIAKVSGWIKDLDSPEFQLEVNAEMDLTNITDFFRIDTLEAVDGDLELRAEMKGRIADLRNISSKDLRDLELSGKLELSDALIKAKGHKHGLQDMSGILMLHNNDAAIRDLKATLAGTDMELNGFFRNLLPHLLVKGERLAVEAQFYSELTDLNGLLESEEQQNKKEKSYHLEFPANIDLNLNAQIDELVFREFSATNISGIIQLADKKLFADPITFSSAGGQVLAQLAVDGTRGDQLPLTVTAKVQQIQIDRLFAEFEGFGQDFIRAEHLKGTATANVTYKASLQQDLSFDLDKTYSMIDIDIENGELIEHEPLVEVADYVRKNPLVAPFIKVKELEKNLRHIQFSRLENQIEIKDRTVHIPAMHVESSALDIELAGTHAFDGYMDHHLNFRMRDLLRTGKESKDEFGPVVDDGTGSRIYLRMYGNAGDLKIENDRDAIKQDRQEYLAKEKEQFKSILKEEFGLFKKDTSLVYQEKDTGKPTFIVEWEDGDTLKGKKDEPDDKKKKKKSWLDRLVMEEDQKETFNDEDEDF